METINKSYIKELAMQHLANGVNNNRSFSRAVPAAVGVCLLGAVSFGLGYYVNENLIHHDDRIIESIIETSNLRCK